MYFGRGHHDPNASAEAQGRLQQFSGATAISSNAYFGREEEDEDERGPGGGAGGGGQGDYGMGDSEAIQQLERGIRDMAGRVMGSQEVQNLTEQVRAGALKVSFAGPVLATALRLAQAPPRRLSHFGRDDKALLLMCSSPTSSHRSSKDRAARKPTSVL